MENLEHLISAYFYEQWDQHEYPSWEAAVDDFVHRSPARALHVPDEIDTLLEEAVSGAALTAQLTAWGFDATPEDGERTWLTAVRDRIRRATGAGFV